MEQQEVTFSEVSVGEKGLKPHNSDDSRRHVGDNNSVGNLPVNVSVNTALE